MNLPLHSNSLLPNESPLDPDAMAMLAVRNGDDEAFADLYERYQRIVRHMIRQFSHRDVPVEDAVQEVFLRMYRARHTYEPKSKFGTWLATIARNVALNAGRSRTRELARNTRIIDRARSNAAQRLSPENTVATTEIRDVILDALNSLGERHRTAITLYAIEGRTYREVADTMQITTSAVKSLLHRARSNLRVKLHKIHYSNDYNVV